MRTPKSMLNLRQFIHRQEVLKLYKQIRRTIREVPKKDDQKYFIDWARRDFKKNKDESDEYVIKALMKNGEAFLKELKQSIDMSK